jgi:Flp pilus assembly pilin Flp
VQNDADDASTTQGGAAPLKHETGGVPAWSGAPPEPKRPRTPPRQTKGGELVLKLLASTLALAASTRVALRRREEGQTMAEYGVMLTVITIAVITAIALLSQNVQNAIVTVAGLLPG